MRVEVINETRIRPSFQSFMDEDLCITVSGNEIDEPILIDIPTSDYSLEQAEQIFECLNEAINRAKEAIAIAEAQE